MLSSNVINRTILPYEEYKMKIQEAVKIELTKFNITMLEHDLDWKNLKTSLTRIGMSYLEFTKNNSTPFDLSRPWLMIRRLIDMSRNNDTNNTTNQKSVSTLYNLMRTFQKTKDNLHSKLNITSRRSWQKVISGYNTIASSINPFVQNSSIFDVKNLFKSFSLNTAAKDKTGESKSENNFVRHNNSVNVDWFKRNIKTQSGRFINFMAKYTNVSFLA